MNATIRSIAAAAVLIMFFQATAWTRPPQQPQFRNVAAEAGLDFRHDNGATPEKHLPETMGSGGLFWDYDNDGWLDILIADGGRLGEPDAADSAPTRVYRNNGDGTFADTTAATGIVDAGHGMGACAADYDNDGWTDVYLTNVRGNRLYRNEGGGKFSDQTASSGADSPLWTTSCGFADVDGDGWVDLYLTNYVDWSVEENEYCTESGHPVYCHPNVYRGQPDVLFLNNGDGTFRDVTEEHGLVPRDGNGLGVVFADLDLDGWNDLYVANDSVPNFLFRNEGEGAFAEIGLLAGVAVGGNGQPQAGMGTDAGDVDGDGRPEILVTNLATETHTLYQNLGNGIFGDNTYASGMAGATLPYVGFGTAFFDFDNDTDLDVVIANGDVIANVALYRDDTTYAQPNLLLRNDGTGRFTDVSGEAGPGFAQSKVSRGLAVGDIDNDGDLDLLIMNNGDTPDLLLNETDTANASILVRLIGAESNRNGIGARLVLDTPVGQLTRQVKAGTSYMSQNDPRVHFGLGSAEPTELRIHWPNGHVDVIGSPPANRILTVTEGEGLTQTTPLAR